MGQPAARVGDLHICPMITPGVPPIPHVGGPILPPGGINVLIGGLPAATLGGMCVCVGPPDVIVRGSFTVLIGGRPAARMGDNTAHGGVITLGFPTVLIGDFGMGEAGVATPEMLNNMFMAALNIAGVTQDTSRLQVLDGKSGSGAAIAGFTTGLGADIDKLAEKSPTLKAQIESLKADHWTIEYRTDGKPGTVADRSAKKILVDPNANKDPATATQVLAHEVGHATYPYVADESSKEKYVSGALADEGAATLNNIKVQREIKNATKGEPGGPTDIGIAGNPANASDYNNAYDQYEKDGDTPAARAKIGKIYGQGEQTSTEGNPKYEDYYGQDYDRRHPVKTFFRDLF